MSELFLPGVPEHLVRQALDRAGGNELASGKFANPESSAALAANGFGWFIERPALLPAFPGLDDIDWPAVKRPGFSGGSFHLAMQPYRGSRGLHSNCLRPQRAGCAR